MKKMAVTLIFGFVSYLSITGLSHVEIGSPQIVTGTKDDVLGLAAKVLNSVKTTIRQ
jgi:hypothetical protein